MYCEVEYRGHYLDNSATTVASLRRLKTFEMMTEIRKPIFIISRGMLAEQELEKARKAVAKQSFAQMINVPYKPLDANAGGQ